MRRLLDPFASVGVYLLLTSVVLDRPGKALGLTIACAVVPYQVITMSVLNASDALQRRRSVLANMAFPRTLMPIASVLTESLAFGLSLVLLALMMAVSSVAPTLAALWLPVAIATTLTVSVGLAYAASLVVLWFPDVRQFAPAVLRAMFFLAPGLVALENVTGIANTLLRLNPLTPIFELYRQSLLFGRAPEPWKLLYPAVISAILLAVFVPLYQREQRHFAKVVA